MEREAPLFFFLCVLVSGASAVLWGLGCVLGRKIHSKSTPKRLILVSFWGSGRLLGGLWLPSASWTALGAAFGWLWGGSWPVLGASWGALWDVLGASGRPRSPPRGPKRLPRGFQEAPKRPPTGSKPPLTGPRKPPRRPQEAPRRPQEAPRRPQGPPSDPYEDPENRRTI